MNRKLLTTIIALTAGLAGCATAGPADPRDPLESVNRGVYQVNDTLDRYLMKPVAEGYVAVVPSPARTCLTNAFNNVNDVWSMINQMLQTRVPDGINTMFRVLLNTTMGVGGCFDIASSQGSPRQPADFGQTLGVWGFGTGPYLVLPLFGPSDLRDTAGLAADSYANPLAISNVDNVPARNSLYAVNLVNVRANYLDAGKMLDNVALDPYSFIRDAYLQRRAAVVREGKGQTGDAALPDYSVPDYGDDDGAPKPAGKP